MINLLRVMFPLVYGTKRSEVIAALKDKEFAPDSNEELYSVFVYMGTVTTKDGQTIMVHDVVVKSPNNVDVTEQLWNIEDHDLVHELVLEGYGEYRPVHCTPYFATLEDFWSIGSNAPGNTPQIFKQGSKKQRCSISSVIVHFDFSPKQLMLLLKLKDCSNTLYKWAI